MARLEITPAPLDGLVVIERSPLGDERGYLERLYCDEELQAAGVTRPIRQINRTLTRQKGAARGVHFQRPPHAEDKLVTCLSGEVFDVAVDLREGSPSYLGWFGVRLSPDNHRSLFIPRGFGHAFQTLSEDAVLLYMHTESYHPESEGGLNIKDPEIGIEWPLPVSQVSARDANLPMSSHEFEGLAL